MENENKKVPAVNEGTKSVNVETYAEDMAKVIEGSQAGGIKNIIHEQEIYEAENKNISPRTRKNKIFIFLSFLLLSLALVMVVFILFFGKKITTVEVAPPVASLIFTDQNFFQSIDDFNKDKIIQSVLNEVRYTTVKSGGVEAIYLTLQKQVIGFREFNKLIQSNFVIPAEPFLKDKFLLGAVNNNTPTDLFGPNKDLFFLLEINSMSDVFSSLRLWEKKMFNDLHDFFNISISSETKELLSKEFSDGYVANKNARILYDKSGNIVMMYVFTNDKSVLFTKSENAVFEIVRRLAASQISK